MTSLSIAGVVEIEAAPAPTGTEQAAVSYERRETFTSYRLQIPRPAPPDLRVTLELGAEGDFIWARIPELDVTAEGETVAETLRNILSAARAWLEYVREDQPDLAEDLRNQARFVGLLDAPEFSWFKRTTFE